MFARNCLARATVLRSPLGGKLQHKVCSSAQGIAQAQAKGLSLQYRCVSGSAMELNLNLNLWCWTELLLRLCQSFVQTALKLTRTHFSDQQYRTAQRPYATGSMLGSGQIVQGAG